MKAASAVKHLGLVVGICAVCALPSGNAFAGPHRGGCDRISAGRHSYSYHHGRVLRPSFFGIDFVFGRPATTRSVTKVVYLPSPVVTTSAAVETLIINIPNSNGSYTPVTLVRQGNGYIGPQGEYYASRPTVAQLKVLYGS